MTVREFDINGLILRGLMADTETEWRDLIREYIAHHVKEDKSYLSDLDNAIKGMFSELRDKVRKGAETLKEQHTDLLKQSENGNPYGQAHPLGGISSEALEELRTKWRQTAERDTDNIKLPLPMQSGKPSGTEERIKFGELLTGETYSVEDLELLEKSYDSTCVNVLGKSEDISDTGEQLTGGVVSVEDLDLLLKRYTEALDNVLGSASTLDKPQMTNTDLSDGQPLQIDLPNELLENLRAEGFIELSDVTPIKWLKNKQLLRELLTNEKVRKDISIADVKRITPTLFINNKNQPIRLANNKEVPSVDSDRIKNFLATL